MVVVGGCSYGGFQPPECTYKRAQTDFKAAKLVPDFKKAKDLPADLTTLVQLTTRRASSRK
jgi:hypothetical protein